MEVDPIKANRLIKAGWNILPDGTWTNGKSTCSIDVALAVADSLPPSPPTPSHWWDNIAGTMRGTVGIGVLTGIVAAIVANPPPEIGMSPTVNTWLKYGLGIVGTVVVGSQIPKAMRDSKESQ